jgi:hypothetical protein
MMIMSLKDKFAAYDEKTNQLAALAEAAERVTKERSDIVKSIAEEVSPKKKILRGGKEMTIVSRNETWFLRGANKPADDKVAVVEE